MLVLLVSEQGEGSALKHQWNSDRGVRHRVEFAHVQLLAPQMPPGIRTIDKRA